MKRSKLALALLAFSSIALFSAQSGCAAEAIQPETQPSVRSAPQAPGDTDETGQPSAELLDQLVAPIALYPDALVAQILAAATYPTEIVEAHRWMQQHRGLEGEALAEEVDSQPWDPSVKALTQFPSVLPMMDKNLSWTSSLGEAYVNGQQNILEAVQVMRQRAQEAGNLQSTQQENVTTQGPTIAIEPADPEVVYVPEYDPWVVYGDPIAFYPGWVGVPGVFIDGPGIAFALGIGIGIFGGFGWGWHHWGTDWHRHDVIHDHNTYISRSPTFERHNGVERGHALLGGSGGFSHGGGLPSHAPSGIHSSAFSGFNHGGVASSFSSRGRASFGGGFHGGGFHSGGGHR